MICPNCSRFERKNIWKCPDCGNEIMGGLVIVTGISGSAVEERLKQVVNLAKGHDHQVKIHDIGQMMYEFAKEDDPDVQWDWILNADERVRRMLRNHAFELVASELKSNPETLHLVDTHLCFRWQVYPTRGVEPHILKSFENYTRCFINIIEDISQVKKRLSKTSWGEREILELLIWREEELFLTDLLSDVCGRVKTYTIAAAEPPSELERIIWHPEIKKVYLSFPITNILEDKAAGKEIETFRDNIRKNFVVFDPYALKDYDDTYTRPEMKAVRKEVGAATEERDYRFIDQADAMVIYYPKKVASKGVDAEMRHCRRTGKTIFLYCPEDLGEGPEDLGGGPEDLGGGPEDLGGGPFTISPNYKSTDPVQYIELLKEKLL